MRQAQAKPGVQLQVVCGDYSRQIAGGAVVDLDAIMVPARDGRAAASLADVLGPHVALFVPFTDPAALVVPVHESPEEP